MSTLVLTELRKLGTTRSLWGFVAAFFGLQVAWLWVIAGNVGSLGAPSVGSVDHTIAVLGSGGRGALVVLVLGVVLVTGEHRHQTLTGTLLAVPRRSRVLVAKAATVAVLGVAAVVLSVATAAVVGGATAGVDLSVVDGEVVLTLVGMLLAMPLYGLLGVGIGALMVNQTAAILVPLIWFVVAEVLIGSSAFRSLVPWTPGGAASAMARDANLPGLLPAWAGAAVLIGYVVGFLLVGGARFTRSDLS